MAQRVTPEINAGSMADIAFLLLIFFLVTTTMDADIGILRRLPDKTIDPPSINILKKNILEIQINSNNEILLNSTTEVSIEGIRKHIVDFIDNGSGMDNDGNTCSWCNGNKNSNSSEHPSKAIIQLQSNRNTSYATYIAVQNEILAAYQQVRNQLSIHLYRQSFETLVIAYKNDKTNKGLQAKIKDIKAKYPQHIFEKESLQID